jgi:2-oxoglutarate ferredoxin oxidoreductase subunit delta
VKFDVIFRTEDCKGCGLCIAFCNKKLLRFDRTYLNKGGVHPAMITEKEECIGCTNCALMCPDAIITIEKLDD